MKPSIAKFERVFLLYTPDHECQLRVPKSMTKKDFELIKRQIEFYLGVIEETMVEEEASE